MPTTTAWPLINDGDEVNAIDFAGMGDSLRTLVANAVASIVGVPTAMPMRNPLTVTASGGMNILVGGSGGQSIFLDSVNGSTTGPRFIDNVAVQTLTIAASASQPRHDLLCAQYTKTLTANGTRSNESTGGSKSDVTADTQNESVSYQVVNGTPASSPVDPSAPTGWVAIARIIVPATATSIVSGNIVILPPTMQSLILSGITSAGYVDMSTAQTVGGNKTFSGVTTIGGIQFAQGDTPYSGVAGIRRNGPNSIVVSPTGPGHGIYLGFDDPDFAGVYFGPGNRWGSITALGYTSPDGTAFFGTNITAGNGYIRAAANNVGLHFTPAKGDLVADRGDGSGVLYLGNSQTSPGQRYLFCNGADYLMPGGNLYLDASFITAGGVFTVANSGRANGAAVNFGNATSSSGQTQLGSNGVSISGVSANLFHIGANTGQTYFAFDIAGNMGILANLNVGGTVSAASAIFSQGARIGSNSAFIPNAGDLCVARNASPNSGYIYFNQSASAYFGFDGSGFLASKPLTVSGNAFIFGTLSVSGALIPNSYISSDFSVNIAQAGQQLNLTIPGGFASSITGDSSVTVAQTGRAVALSLPGSFINAVSSDGSVTTSQSGRTVSLSLPGNYVNAVSSSDGSVSVTQTGRAIGLVLPSGFVNSFATDGSLTIAQSGRTLTTSLSGSIRSGTIAPVYSPSGAIVNAGMKIVTGQTLVSSANQVITLSGNAVFSSVGSYQVIANSIFFAGTAFVSVQVDNVSGSQFQLSISGSSPATVSWIAIGY